MANLSQLIQAAVAEWRDGRSAAELRDAEAAVVEFDDFEVEITPLPTAVHETLAVTATVIGSDGNTLAEARIELRDN